MALNDKLVYQAERHQHTVISMMPFQLFLATRVSPEVTRGSELSQFMPDHVLGNIYGDELVPIMHGKGVAHEIRRNRRTTAPCLNDSSLGALHVHLSNFLF